MPPPRKFIEPLPLEIPEGGVTLRGTNYVLLKLLGRGAHGLVYLVHNPEPDRKEVMKILSEQVFELKPELVEEIVYRFKFEAQALCRIRNEHVVHVNHVGLLPDGRPFFTMDYSQGVPLTTRLRAGQPLPLRELLGYAIKMADGLAACHARGVIHRDFKPANVLVGPDGAVTIIDFGIAKAAQEHGHLHGGWTQAGAMMGTPAYMAPEQASGSSDAVGPATDVYALGVVLFVMLTGRLVFEGNTHDQLFHKLHTPEPSPITAGANCPPELDQLVARMLAKDFRQRIQSASEVRAELQRIQKLLPADHRVAVEEVAFDAPTMDARYDTAVRAAAGMSAQLAPPTAREAPTADALPRRPTAGDREAPTADARMRLPDRAVATPVDATTDRMPARKRAPLWAGALIGAVGVGLVGVVSIFVLARRTPADAAVERQASPPASVAPIPAAPPAAVTELPTPSVVSAPASQAPAPAKAPVSTSAPPLKVSPPIAAKPSAAPTTQAAPKPSAAPTTSPVPKTGAMDDPF